MSNFIKGLIIGASAGAVAGILLAPKSGRETREQLSKVAGDTTRKISDKYHELKEKSEEGYRAVVDNLMADYEKLHLDEDQKNELKDEVRRFFKKIQSVVNEK